MFHSKVFILVALVALEQDWTRNIVTYSVVNKGLNINPLLQLIVSFNLTMLPDSNLTTRTYIEREKLETGQIT